MRENLPEVVRPPGELEAFDKVFLGLFFWISKRFRTTTGDFTAAIGRCPARWCSSKAYRSPLSTLPSASPGPTIYQAVPPERQDTWFRSGRFAATIPAASIFASTLSPNPKRRPPVLLCAFRHDFFEAPRVPLKFSCGQKRLRTKHQRRRCPLRSAINERAPYDPNGLHYPARAGRLDR